MTVNLSLFAGAGWQFFDNSGVPLSGGLVYTYQAGTTTPQTTYTTSEGNAAHTNPIILNSAGRVPSGGEIWLTNDLSYKFILKDSVGVLIGSYDNIYGFNGSALNTFISDLANNSDPTKGDALVGFRQSNSAGNLPNAVGRTVHQKLQETVSVKDFGAVGDGLTDDTTAITNAIAAVAGGGSGTSLGGSVYFPNGTYAHTGITHLPGVQLYGDKNTTLKYTGTSVGITTPAVGGYFQIEGLHLLTTTGAIQYRIQGTSSQLEMTDVLIEGGSLAGVIMNNTANNAHFLGCTFTNCGSAGVPESAGLVCTANANSVGLVNCIFESNNGWGIFSNVPSRGWTISASLIEGNTLGGILLQGINGINISGCYFENLSSGTYQIFITNTGAVVNTGVSIVGNIFGCATSFDCLNLQFITGLTVTSNEFRASRYGIDISGGNTSYTIANNALSTGTAIAYNGVAGLNQDVITDIGQTYNLGNSSGTFALAGLTGRNFNAQSTSANTTPTVLQTTTLPANTFTSVNGTAIRVTASGSFAANGNTKTIQLKINGVAGTTISQTASTYNNLSWRLDMMIYKVNATNLSSMGNIFVGATVAATDVATGTVINAANANTIDLVATNGTATAGDIVCNAMYVEYLR
jgi:hypothetical protein